MKLVSRASAPGSAMLFGEHAVLLDYPAVVAAIDHRMQVAWEPNNSATLTIESDLGSGSLPIDTLPTDGGTGSLRFLIAAVARQPQTQRGGCLRVECAFAADVGFGSSAAVTVAAIAAMQPTLVDSPALLLEEAIAVIQAVQGRGSGADAAASVYGGVCAFSRDPLTCRRIAAPFPIALVYAGIKVPTPEVLATVARLRTEEADRVDTALAAMGSASLRAITTFEAGPPYALAEPAAAAMTAYRELALSSPALDTIVDTLLSAPDVVGAKISGSGLGDCAIAFGSHTASAPPFPSLVASISTDGVRLEKESP